MKPLSNTELHTFCSQFALILRSGISSLEGITIMLDDIPKGEGHDLLEILQKEVETTGSFAMALQTAQCFPPYMCSMAELGEQSGRLDDVMDNLARHYRREDQLSKSIRSAVTYPLIMLGMMAAVMLVLIIKVLPVFQQVFDQLGVTMTGFSGTVLKMGAAMNRYSVVFLVFAVLLAGLFFYFLRSSRGQKIFGSFASRFSLTRRLSEKTACARFASGMYLCLSSGLDTEQSLEMTARLIEHEGISRKIKTIQENLAEGTLFPEALENSNIFSGLYSHMVNIGLRTGAADEVMKQISEQYDEEVEDQMNRLVAGIEPTLVAILSIAVGMILFSVMLPLMGIMSNMG